MEPAAAGPTTSRFRETSAASHPTQSDEANAPRIAHTLTACIRCKQVTAITTFAFYYAWPFIPLYSSKPPESSGDTRKISAGTDVCSIYRGNPDVTRASPGASLVKEAIRNVNTMTTPKKLPYRVHTF